MKTIRPLLFMAIFLLGVSFFLYKLEQFRFTLKSKAVEKKTQTPNVVNGKPVIRIVNFNPGSVASPTDPIPKWQGIADYIATQNVEILLLQEPANRELEAIRTAFATQFPYMTYIKSRQGGELNPILSRYPFVEGSQQEWQINSEKRRVVLSIQIQTPYGPLRVVNLHTHGDYQCKDAYNALEPLINSNSPYFNPPNQAFIIAGDFNIKLRSVGPSTLLESVCFKNTDYTQKLAQIIRPNFKANCLDVNTCQNQASGANENIEMIWSMNNSPIEIYKMWDAPSEIANQFNDVNRHPLVFAEIGDPNWRIPSTPTLIPTPTPLPTVTPILTPTPASNATLPGPITISTSFRLSGIDVKPSAEYCLNQKFRITIKNPLITDLIPDAIAFPSIDGRYTARITVPSGPLGEYKIAIKGPAHLQKTFTSQIKTTNESLDFSSTPLLPGDLPNSDGNQTGVLDSSKILNLRSLFLKTDSTALSTADVNCDGIINTIDHELLLRSMMLQYEDEK